MNAEARIALGLGLALIATCAAPRAVRSGGARRGAAPAVQRTGSVDYLNGGAGEEERAPMTAHQAAFPLRIVCSQPGGAYVVADRVDAQPRRRRGRVDRQGRAAG